MPGRVSRVSAPSSITAGARSKSTKNSAKRKRRNLDAFSIASKLEPERSRIRSHRLGEVEQDGSDARQTKRVKVMGQDGAEDEDEVAARRVNKSNSDEYMGSDEDRGSDGEGNEWRTGRIDQDEDSNIDSDEAFGDSDEEKFQGFTFRGSSSAGKMTIPKSVGSLHANDLEEDDLRSLDRGEDEDEDFGNEGIDLADVLDESGNEEDISRVTMGKDVGSSAKLDDQDDDFQSFGSESDAPSEADEIEEDGQVKLNQNAESDSEDPSSRGSELEEGSQIYWSDEESDENDPVKLQQLQNVASSLSRINTEPQDTRADSRTQANRMLAALKAMPVLDPVLSRSVRKLTQNLGNPIGSKPDGLLQAPLPKRQQDLIDRTAASKEANATLARWTDTVKHNRRAEHLSFPLKDPEAQEAQGTNTFLSMAETKPRNDLESTIENILQESGLAAKGGRSSEAQIRAFEELQTNKLPMEEVLARRAELRKARDLMFREEMRSKRIKKIKSKAYRRVHRKEEQRTAQRERIILAQAGVDLSDEEREKNDRRRAEERMGARHRESRWAKGMKQSGRAIWDEDARSGAIEMARRNDELRQRMEGRRERNESDLSDDPEDDSENEFDLQGSLDRVEEGFDTQPKSRLDSMKFMQQAETARKRQNDETIEQMRRELAGAESDESNDAAEEPEPTLGRRKFGPSLLSRTEHQAAKRVNEFEEHPPSHSESEAGDIERTREAQRLNPSPSPPIVEHQKLKPKPQLPFQQKARQFRPAANLSQAQESSVSGSKTAIDDAQNQMPAISEATAPSSINGWTVVKYSANGEQDGVEGDDEGSEAQMPLMPTNEDLVRAAFGGDDVEEAFAKEKNALVKNEDDKVIDNALPGWGSWVGDGVGKRELRRNKGKFLTREAGIKPQNRKDAKLERAIISEKRLKKNAKYLASTLPHPFESRQQYERALRIPVGPEWTTKETFQSATKPRVMVKQGIIKPMEAPML